MEKFSTIGNWALLMIVYSLSCIKSDEIFKLELKTREYHWDPKFITQMKMYDEINLRKKFIPQLELIKKIISLVNWWKLYILDKNSSILSKVINVMRGHQYEKMKSLWWKLIILMKIYKFDENSSLWDNFITFLKMHH